MISDINTYGQTDMMDKAICKGRSRLKYVQCTVYINGYINICIYLNLIPRVGTTDGFKYLFTTSLPVAQIGLTGNSMPVAQISLLD